MKKWLKLNYRYYVTFLLAFVSIMLIKIPDWFGNYIWLDRKLNMNQNTYYILGDIINNTSSSIRVIFFSMHTKLFVLGFLILHGIMLWGQRNKSEREFLQTLPFKREKVVLYRFIMDMAMVFIVVFISAIATLVYVKRNFNSIDLHIDWLGSTMVGVCITLVCYMVMILGVIYFIEALVVRGDLKIITTAACLGILFISMSRIYEFITYGKQCLFNKIMAYLKLYSPGGTSYVVEPLNLYVTNAGWKNNRLLYEAVFEGKEYTLSNRAGSDYFSTGNGVVGFREIELYIWYALSYLLIGILLIAIGITLTKLQDVSKRGFYFSFGKIMVAMVVFIGIFSMIFAKTNVWYYGVIAGLLGIVIFGVLIYTTTGKTLEFKASQEI